MPHRKKIIFLLENYNSNDHEQKKIKEKFLRFINENDDCFLRSNLFGHLTASCFLLCPEKKHVLLTHHKKIGDWLQLGGHADGDSDLLNVSLKEAQEESGIDAVEFEDKNIFDLDIHTIAEHKNVPAHLHFDVRFLLRAKTKNYKVSDESHALAWISLEEIAASNLYSPSLTRMAKKWIHLKSKTHSQQLNRLLA